VDKPEDIRKIQGASRLAIQLPSMWPSGWTERRLQPLFLAGKVPEGSGK